jgi:hypothetical protein
VTYDDDKLSGFGFKDYRSIIPNYDIVIKLLESLSESSGSFTFNGMNYPI